MAKLLYSIRLYFIKAVLDPKDDLIFLLVAETFQNHTLTSKPSFLHLEDTFIDGVLVKFHLHHPACVSVNLLRLLVQRNEFLSLIFFRLYFSAFKNTRFICRTAAPSSYIFCFSFPKREPQNTDAPFPFAYPTVPMPFIFAFPFLSSQAQ